MPWVDLPGGYVLAFEAISPTTGSAITGVTVAEIAVYGVDLNIGGVIEFEPLENVGDLEFLNIPSRG